MHYIILDLEATCWEQRDRQPNEIIEIGAVCVGEDRQVKGEFCTFVKPVVHPQLSDFCTKLTSITQQQVDGAPGFPQALAEFQQWIKSFGDAYLLCSWGFYDRTQLEKDCRAHSCDTSWLQAHISLKHQYAALQGWKQGIGMAAALKRENLELEGTHHRGIDDAKNIAKLFIKLFDQWQRPA